MGLFSFTQKWSFPSNNYGQINGIADSGVETFKGTPIKSLAREICQNSLDAHRENSEATRIEFKTFDIETKNIRNGIENAKIVGERLRATVEAMKIPLPDKSDCISVTISVGFTERQPGDSVETIIKRADDALYNAKENGRNRVCVNLGDGTMFLF